MLKEEWLRGIPGQKSGISWRYAQMLAGEPGVKPDRMILAFMNRVGVPQGVTPKKFIRQIVEEVDMPSVDSIVVDHRMWSVERDMRRRRK